MNLKIVNLSAFCTFIIPIICAESVEDGSLRLTGGVGVGSGRLEVFYNGTWGTVCDDGFGSDEASVACWQLGFSRTNANASTIGPDVSNPPILLDDLRCQGGEERLGECQHRPWGHNDCKNVEHVAVDCTVDPCRKSPCQNNATCIPLNDVNVTCQCSPVTTGRWCDTFINFCDSHNGGCSHECFNSGPGSYECACPPSLLLGADGHSCYAPSVSVECGERMDVTLERRQWPGLHEQYLTLTDSTCRAEGNLTHINLSAPLYGCGTTSQVLSDGFLFENRVLSHVVPVAGLVSRVREVNMTLRCHYDVNVSLDNWYIVNDGQIHFSDVSRGHYQLNMDLYHNGQEYVGGGPQRVEPGEDLSIKFSLSSNDSSLQVFARNCKATTSAQGASASQFLFLDDGCGKDSSLHLNRSSQSLETLQLQAFQFVTNDSSALLLHCDVIVCDVTDPFNRCTQGCLTAPREGVGNDEEEVVLKGSVDIGPFAADGNSLHGRLMLWWWYAATSSLTAVWLWHY